MSAQPEPHLTPTDYLAIERASADMRHEYFRGEIFLMGGASREHNLIGANLGRLIGNQLAKTDCEYYLNDMRVKIDSSGLYTYPDLVLTCDKPKFEDEHVDTLLNPQAIIEILSDSTESYDRGKKFEHYRSLPSLREYFLVSQDRPHVERFMQDDQGVWSLSEATGLEASIAVDMIDHRFVLKDVYAKVTFPEASE